MSPVYITHLTGLLNPSETPFEKAGRDKRHPWFIYMTNRQTHRFSPLFDASDAKTVMDQAFEFIPMGYTQLWLFEKRFAAHPKGPLLPKERTPTYNYEASYPASLERLDWVGRLFVVLRQPRRTPIHDVVSYHTREPSAIQAAERYTRDQGRQAVVGLMQADHFWH